MVQQLALQAGGQSKDFPTLKGVYDATYVIGSPISQLELNIVKVIDEKDGDISSKVKVLGPVYYEIPGEYDQEIFVVDSMVINHQCTVQSQ